MESGSQKPLELILARNLLTSISTPAFLLDDEAARASSTTRPRPRCSGARSRTRGDGGRASGRGAFGPFDEGGEPGRGRRARDDRGDPRTGGPTHAEFTIKAAGGEQHAIEASAFPIVASEAGSSGAMILFWPVASTRNGRAG